MAKRGKSDEKIRSLYIIVTLILIPIVTGIVASGIVLWWQYIHAQTPNIIVVVSPGTEFVGQAMQYKNFYITLINNGTAQANYLTFFVNPTVGTNGIILNNEIFMTNVSIKKVAYSCEAEITDNGSVQVAVSNFGPEQSCQVNLSVSLEASGLTNYTVDGKDIGNYTNLQNYYNENYTRMFSLTVPISDSNWCYVFYSQTPIQRSVPVASGVTSANGSVIIPLHQGFSGEKMICKK